MGVRSHDSFLHSDQTVHKLEYRTRRVVCLHRTVEHRLIWVRSDFRIMLSDVRKHVHVNTRTRNHSEDLACRRFDGHKTAHLVLHKLLTVVLEFGVNGRGDVLAGYGVLVHFAVLISGLDSVS